MCLPAYAQTFYYPDGLEAVSGNNVFSVIRDRDGAMWLNTSSGFFRYNGNVLEKVRDYASNSQIVVNDAGNLVYVLGTRLIHRYDVERTSPTGIAIPDTLRGMPFMTASGDSLVVGLGHDIFVSRADSLAHVATLPAELSDDVISAISCHADGTFLFGTSGGHLLACNLRDSLRRVAGFGSPVSCIYSPDSSSLWIGTRSELVSCSIDDCEVKVRDSFGIKGVRTLRIFGDILYAGSSERLFCIGNDGTPSPVSVLGDSKCPVFCIYGDECGDMWIGTMNKGCLLAETSSSPFKRIAVPSGLEVVRGMAKDCYGSIWALTDGHGAFVCKNGRWHMVPGSDRYKFQFAASDPSMKKIWTSDYEGRLLRIDTATERISEVPTETGSETGNIWSAHFLDDGTLFLGTSSGLIHFDSSSGKAVRCGIDAVVFCVAADGNGEIWAGTNRGVYRYQNGSVEKVETGGRGSRCTDLICTSDGRMVAAISGEGLVVLENACPVGKFTIEDGMLLDDNVRGLVEFGDSQLVVACQNGLSLIDTGKMSAAHYTGASGIRTRKDCFLEADGVLYMGGTDRILAMDSKSALRRPYARTPVFDHFYVNGAPRISEGRLPYESRIDLKYDEANFSVDVTDFNFTFSSSRRYEYMLDGFSKEWSPMELGNNPVFMNMPSGRYTLLVREVGSTVPCTSLKIRIHPVWYATVLARIIFILLAIVVTMTMIRLYVNREVLAEKLEHQADENRRKTQFFVDLSNRIRTPLNIMMINMERYFKTHGINSQGVEDIEDVYSRAVDIRKLISDYVDEQGETEMPSVAEDVKFLNAVTGVVESHLFERPVTTGLLCDSLGIGRTTLAERLQKITGKTIHEFVEEIKLRHAAQMILDGNKRISQIADDLCFSSPNHFALRFKTKYGCSPSEFKRRH